MAETSWLSPYWDGKQGKGRLFLGSQLTYNSVRGKGDAEKCKSPSLENEQRPGPGISVYY